MHVSYGKVEAVRGAALAVDRGQIVTMIGPNGAGKTTLLAAVIGLLRSRGRISFDGRDIAGLDVEDRVQAGMSLVPERRELFGDMSVADNLELGAYLHRGDGNGTRARLAAVYGRFPRLAERRRQLASTLSGGERQMLALGRALMSDPKMLMLDEPSLGLAPRIVKDVFQILLALKQTGISILLVEQNARAALQVADYAYVMELGRFVKEGSPSDISQDPELVASYLGLGKMTY